MGVSETSRNSIYWFCLAIICTDVTLIMPIFLGFKETIYTKPPTTRSRIKLGCHIFPDTTPSSKDVWRRCDAGRKMHTFVKQLDMTFVMSRHLNVARRELAWRAQVAKGTQAGFVSWIRTMRTSEGCMRLNLLYLCYFKCFIQKSPAKEKTLTRDWGEQ